MDKPTPETVLVPASLRPFQRRTRSAKNWNRGVAGAHQATKPKVCRIDRRTKRKRSKASRKANR